MNNDNMQDILKNYYASGGKTLFENTDQWISHRDLANIIYTRTGDRQLALDFDAIQDEFVSQDDVQSTGLAGFDADPLEFDRERVNKILKDNSTGVKVVKMKQDAEYNTLYQILQSARLDADVTEELDTMRRLINIVEAAEAQALEEGLLTKAAVFASLAALLMSAGVNLKQEPQDHLNSEVNQIMQDITQDANTMEAWSHTPQEISNMFGIPLELIVDSAESKHFGKPMAGSNNAGFDHVDVQRVSGINDRMSPGAKSKTHRVGNYSVNVTRTSNAIGEYDGIDDKFPRGTVAYVSSCFVNAELSLNSGYVFASKLIKFYHVGSADIENLTECNPEALIKQLESEFRSNPVYYNPDKA